MRCLSSLRRNNPEHGTDRPVRESMACDEQMLRDHLEDRFHVLDVFTSGKARIAIFARERHHQTPRLYLSPELLVVHRCQPFFHIIARLEHCDDRILSNPVGELQTSNGRGRP